MEQTNKMSFNDVLYTDFNLYCNSFYNRQCDRIEAEKQKYENNKLSGYK